MDTTILSAAEAAEYVEFKRTRREAEIALMLHRIVVDASRRETEKHALKTACENAKKIGAGGVLVSPVNVSAAHRNLAGSAVKIACLVGGTGESLPSVKKTEAKKAIRQGATELRLVLCHSALAGGNLGYLKREIKKIRKTAKKCALIVSLEDHTFSEENIALGVRAACEAKADGVAVRGEISLVLCAATAAAGRTETDCTDVENAEQLRTVFQAGAARATTRNAELICEELYSASAGGDAPPQAPLS